MSSQRPAMQRRSIRSLRALLVVIIGSMLIGGALAGCADTSATAQPMWSVADSQSAAAPAAAVPMGAMTMPTTDEVTAAWQARPGYVKALPSEGQAAYAFALARPDVLQWMPCYCGCAGVPHRSNLDCFCQRREVKGTYLYEQHASFCNVCIKTANLAGQLLGRGKTVTQIRATVDATFGGGSAPGTDTAQPPAS